MNRLTHGDNLDIKPCPFCGAKAEMLVEYGRNNRPLRYKITCQNYKCHAEIVNRMPVRGPRQPKGSPYEDDERYYKSIRAFNAWCEERSQETISAWNRRATP